MDRDDFDPVRAGFAAFRTNWPHYRNSIFKDKVEVVTDGRGKILGVTNPSSLLYAFLPSSSEGIQIIEVGERAFSSCSSLRTISFSSNLEYVAPYAFSGTSSLESCNFTSTYLEFGEGVFSSSGIKTFSFPSFIKEIPSKFFSDCKRLYSVSMPKALESIGPMAFSGTESLRSIDLGFSLLEIPDGAFLGSAIESIYIPYSVKRIGVSAFSSCHRLGKIWYDGSAEDFRRIEFGMHWNRGIRKDSILYIKDKEGRWVNAFSGKKEEKREEDPKKEEYLSILGLKGGESKEEIGEAYRREVRKFHPDTISGLDLPKEYMEFASERFMKIREAYDYLILRTKQ